MPRQRMRVNKKVQKNTKTKTRPVVIFAGVIIVGFLGLIFVNEVKPGFFARLIPASNTAQVIDVLTPSNLQGSYISAGPRVDLSWTYPTVDYRTVFRIERKCADSATWISVRELGSETRSYSDLGGLTCNFAFMSKKDISYRIRAARSDTGKFSIASSPIIVTLGTPLAAGSFNPPGNLTAKIEGTKTVRLTWEDNSNTETGYRVNRREGTIGIFQGFPANVGIDTWADKTTTLDYGTQHGKTYQYLVQTVRYAEVKDSHIVTVTIPALWYTSPSPSSSPTPPAPAPTDVKANVAADWWNPYSPYIKVNWGYRNSTEFIVKRWKGASASGEAETFKTLYPVFNDKNTTKGNSYTYQVCLASNPSICSSVVTVKWPQ